MQDHRKNGITEIDTTYRQRIVSIGAVSQFLSVSGIYNVESVVAKTKAPGGRGQIETGSASAQAVKHRRHAGRRSDFQGGVSKMSHSY